MDHIYFSVLINSSDWTAWAIVIVDDPTNIAICCQIHMHNCNNNHNVHDVVRVEPEIKFSGEPLLWDANYADDPTSNWDDVL